MSDNPQASPLSVFRLGFGVVTLAGPDAVKFVQAQCMSDVSALAAGCWHWSGWLTPKGRVIAVFALLKLDPQTLWLVLPDSDATALAERLKRFVFRSKVTIAVPDLCVAGAFDVPRQARGAAIAGDAIQGLELDAGGNGGPRRLWIGRAGAPDDARALARWTCYDLAHGLPRLPADQAEQWTPQMLSLERLRAFSVKKGCYPGQEIVARTHFLGQAKRGLALLHADAPLAAGAEVGDGAKTLGTIVSSADDADGTLALAVLPLERDAGPLRAGATPLHERPLLGGLAR